MKGVNMLYLGWDNPRQAISIDGHDIVVLTDGPRSSVLQDAAARSFKEELRELNHHFMGGKRSTRMETLIRSVPHDPHHHNVYDALFEGHFPNK